ncbi:MAG: N-6 DNA methylase [Puniceicoccales bacterium]|nr:N-6 DNA methylase [Puniceicoccales bacterium]
MVGDRHRRSLGQYFTPPAVASFMRDWVLASGISSLYDPAFGLGAFFPAEMQAVDFSASEVDATAIDFHKKNNTKRKVRIYNEDYLLSWGRKHANIVCNPPYKRFQNFQNRAIVSVLFEKHLGKKLPGHTNTASAFLLKSLSELDGRGRLAYIMPFEFLNTGYGSLVKEELIKNSSLAAVIKLDCEKDVFPDVTTSVCILLYEAAVRHETVDFHSIQKIDNLGGFQSLKPANRVSVSQLKPGEKWGNFFKGSRLAINLKQTVPLYFYGRFSRGIATGANEFFVLSPSKAKSLGLGKNDCRPCITKSAQIQAPFFGRDNLRQMFDGDEQVLLFSANGNASPAAREYIQHGQQQGFHERFLTRHRTPWYKTEERSPAPLLLGVFSRGGYKIIWNESDALNLTCYHGFQPNMFGEKYLRHLFLYLLSATGREVAAFSMRTYGNSLDKFEPNDINNVPVPSPDHFEKISTNDIDYAIREIRDDVKNMGAFGHFFDKMEDSTTSPQETYSTSRFSLQLTT